MFDTKHINMMLHIHDIQLSLAHHVPLLCHQEGMMEYQLDVQCHFQ